MQTKSFLAALFIVITVCSAHSTDLEISNIRSLNRGDVEEAISVVFDIRWENSWYNSKNYDAAWIFIKYDGQRNNHARIQPGSPTVLVNRSTDNQPIDFQVSEDQMGFFIAPSSSFRGDIDIKVQVTLDTTGRTIRNQQTSGLQVYGIEMVFIPEGPFTLGSPDEQSITRASLYQSDSEGNSAGLYRIESEEAIAVGPQEGQLYYWSNTAIYNGDQQGPIPAEFPKGHSAFYVMKYELNQGQYVDFLNAVPDGWTYSLAPQAGKGYYKKRGSIYLKNDRYYAKSPKRPMNFISFTDGLAYTDWAGLRPITELEYTKAARGPAEPTPKEFVWGTDNYDHLERYVNAEHELILANGLTEAELTDDNRAVFGASYYWVMDLSGSVWEKVITIGNPIGRSFKGTHGDGNLSFAKATNEDWPTSDDEIGGFGYRGGGYYETGTAYTDFNPHSPIGYRFYGSWSGGPRSIAYGYRAGRSK